jgi:hypothetical protein
MSEIIADKHRLLGLQIQRKGITLIMRLRTYLKSQFPLFVFFWRRVRYSSLAKKSPKQLFTEIFRENKWEIEESHSGRGSTLIETEVIRKALPPLIRELKCESLLDIPCGDFYWMKFVELGAEYIGGDIVDELVKNNQEQFGCFDRRFVILDLIGDELPKCDMVLCRDCLVHFSYQHISQAIQNIKKSGSKYLLTTTFVERTRNEDIPTSAWRPINLQLPPFSFPPPMKLIDEACPMQDYRDKSLGLWKIDDLPEIDSFIQLSSLIKHHI